jgi:hypothetical protein
MIDLREKITAVVESQFHSSHRRETNSSLIMKIKGPARPRARQRNQVLQSTLTITQSCQTVFTPRLPQRRKARISKQRAWLPQLPRGQQQLLGLRWTRPSQVRPRWLARLRKKSRGSKRLATSYTEVFMDHSPSCRGGAA